MSITPNLDPGKMRDRDPMDDVCRDLNGLELPPLPKPKGPRLIDRIILWMKNNKVLAKAGVALEIAVVALSPEGKVGAIIVAVVKKLPGILKSYKQNNSPKQEGGSTMSNNSVKPGIRTTEFWMTIISVLLTVIGSIGNIIPPDTAAVIIAAMTGLYNVLRALTKAPEITTVVQK